jgi:hypothetical protein
MPPKQPVFTVFNHGTNASRDGEGEIVAEFGRMAAGAEYTNYLITDGPGSKPSTAPTPGQFNPFTRNKAPKKVLGKTEMGHTHKNWALTGTLFGSGWDDNVIHAVAAISELDPLPGTVNMIGWSRGGVTCTKMAFKLREVYPNMDVNIFAVDPVAGIGNKGDEDASTIRGNVRNYLAVLSMHETRGFFKPQDIKRVTFTNPETNAIYLPFPGAHGGQVNLDKSCRKDIGEAAQAVWFLAMRFLRHLGTQFNSNPSPTYDERELCNLYAKMRIKMPGYKKSSPGVGGAFMGGRKTRDFLKHRVHEYVKHSNFFINEHHRRVFKRAYPGIYQWVFENQGTNAALVSQEYKGTRNLTALKQTLDDLGFQAPQPGSTQGVLLPIRGSGQEEVRILGEQHASSLSQMGLY